MSLPMNRPSSILANHVPDGFSRSEGRELVRLENRELARGLVAATRIQAAALTASVGMQCTGMLSREASFQAHGDPATVNRLNFIVDQFAAYVGDEVARFGQVR